MPDFGIDTHEDRVALVEKAAALLDQYAPLRWWERIDLDDLDMFDYDRCVLGQVFRSEFGARAFPDACDRLQIAIGGQTVWTVENYGTAFAARQLTNYWRDLVRARRSRNFGRADMLKLLVDAASAGRTAQELLDELVPPVTKTVTLDERDVEAFLEVIDQRVPLDRTPAVSRVIAALGG